MLKDQYQGDADRLQDNASDLETIVDKGVSRRNFLRGGAAAMGLFLAASPLAQAVAAATRSQNPSKLTRLQGFDSGQHRRQLRGT